MNRAYLAAGLILLLAVFIAGWSWNGALWGERYSKLEGRHAQELAIAEKQAREEESRRVAAIEEVRKDANEKIKQAAADAVAASAAADSLRGQVDKLARRPARCPAAADGGAADPDKLLLAQLLSEADEAAGRMAEAADRSRIAGEACVLAYEALQP